MKKERNPVVHYPSDIEATYTGEIFGYYHYDTNEYNIILDTKLSQDSTLLGSIIEGSKVSINSPNVNNVPLLIGKRDGSQLTFFQEEKECELKPYDLKATIFSRNTGILETDKMFGKSAIISGCGSVGSLVALELARSGVGTFLLIDHDTFEYHNICRHQCGIQDVGKFKVNAIKERILAINPNAKVYTQPEVIERVPKSVFDKVCCENEAIFIGCADNREGDLYADTLSKHYRVPFVSIGFWERAFAGEVFYSIPGETVGYESIFKGELSSRVSENRRVYTFEEDIKAVEFEPGISVDIAFVTIVAIKLVLDLLNRGDEDYIPKVLNDLTQFTLICNTNDTRIGKEQAEIFSYPLQITRSIVVS